MGTREGVPSALGSCDWAQWSFVYGVDEKTANSERCQELEPFYLLINFVIVSLSN
jgi:hypothetical protein